MCHCQLRSMLLVLHVYPLYNLNHFLNSNIHTLLLQKVWWFYSTVVRFILHENMYTLVHVLSLFTKCSLVLIVKYLVQIHEHGYYSYFTLSHIWLWRNWCSHWLFKLHFYIQWNSLMLTTYNPHGNGLGMEYNKLRNLSKCASFYKTHCWLRHKRWS